MRRHLRINYLLIALLALAVAITGSVGMYFLSEHMAYSAMWYGLGTEEDPYLLYSDSQLVNLQELSSGPFSAQYTAGKYFVLKNNLKLPTAAKKSSCYGFQGVLDGDGHIVTLGEGAMFYRLLGGGVVKNLNVKFNLTVNSSHTEVCAVARSVDEAAVVENCVAEGVINVESPPFNPNQRDGRRFPAPANCASFAIVNDGMIRDCTFRGRICSKDTSIEACFDGRMYIGGITAGGNGLIESCEVHADMDLVPVGRMTFIGGVSPMCAVNECKYYGNIKCVIDITDLFSFEAARYSTVYGLGYLVHDGYFEGDIMLSPIAKEENFQIAQGESTYEFRGRFFRMTTDGCFEEIMVA